MATWQDLPPEIALRILQFVFASKRVTFRRRPRSDASHDTKLLSILTISKTFVDYNVVLGAMLESVDVVLYSVTELYKLGTHLGSHDKSALRYTAVIPNCSTYPAVGDLSLREIKSIFPGIKVIDLGDWRTPNFGTPTLNMSQHSMLYALSMQVANDSILPALPLPMPNPVKAVRATFNLEECRQGNMNMQEASTLMVTPWKQHSKRFDYPPGRPHLHDRDHDRDTWQKSLLVHGKGLQVEIKFWEAIDIQWIGQYVMRCSVSGHPGPLMERSWLNNAFRPVQHKRHVRSITAP